MDLRWCFAMIKKNYCTKTMHDWVHAHPHYGAKIKDDSIELLKAIRVLIHHVLESNIKFYGYILKYMCTQVTC
jgi:hypothetical protein